MGIIIRYRFKIGYFPNFQVVRNKEEWRLFFKMFPEKQVFQVT